MSCEDYPCCGHESGCCPDFDESGKQLNMRCTCGAVLPVNNPVSLCNACLDQESESDLYDERVNADDDDFDAYDPIIDDDEYTDFESDREDHHLIDE